MGALKRFLQLDHVFRGLFVRDDKDMKETVSDETAEGGKRRERPDDLKDKGRRDCDSEQDHHHASPANEIPAAHAPHEPGKSDQQTECRQQIERRVAYVARLIPPPWALKKKKHLLKGFVTNPAMLDARIEYPDQERIRAGHLFRPRNDDEESPRENERDKREEEQYGIGIQDPCPAKSRKYAPCAVKDILCNGSKQKAAIEHLSRGLSSPRR